MPPGFKARLIARLRAPSHQSPPAVTGDLEAHVVTIEQPLHHALVKQHHGAAPALGADHEPLGEIDGLQCQWTSSCKSRRAFALAADGDERKVDSGNGEGHDREGLPLLSVTRGPKGAGTCFGRPEVCGPDAA